MNITTEISDILDKNDFRGTGFDHVRATEALHALIVRSQIELIETMLKTADEAEKGNDYKWSRKSYREYLEWELARLHELEGGRDGR